MDNQAAFSVNGDNRQVVQEVCFIGSSAPVSGHISVAGSKSMTNRALLAAAVAEGISVLAGILISDDTNWCVACLRQLGVSIEVSGNTAVVTGCSGRWPVASGQLYMGSAGTVARFLPGLLAAGTGSWSLNGSEQLRQRPIKPLLDVLAELGAEFHNQGAAGALPVSLRARGLSGGVVELTGESSSQFISGILLCSPYANSELAIHLTGTVVQRGYVNMTLDVMAAFGVKPQVSNDGSRIVVQPEKYKAAALALEPDVSTCGYFWALAAITKGRIRIEGIDAATKQPDIELLDIMERMGCLVDRGDQYIEVTGVEQLRGGYQVDLQRASDQAATVAMLAVFADQPIRITGVAHIRLHECDRIAVLCSELSKLGIRTEEHADGLTVFPGIPQAAVIDPHDDHRIAMAFSLLGTRTTGLRISNSGCVSKTCPDFFVRLKSLGVELELE